MSNTAPIGWCHACNRDITSTADHAPRCPVSDRGPDHPEIRPLEQPSEHER